MAVTNGFKKWLIDSVVAQYPLKIMLLDANHNTDIDTQKFVNSVSGNEISGTGYPAGGFTLPNAVGVQNNDTDKVSLDTDNLSLTGTINFAARYTCAYFDTGDPATSPIIKLNDINPALGAGVQITYDTTPMTISPNALGLLDF